MAAYQNITPFVLAQEAVTVDYIAIYTVPTNTRTYVKDITFCNTTASNKKFYLSLVPNEDAPGTANAIFYNTNIPAYTTVQWTGAQMMDEADTIQVKADATGLTVNVTGGEAQ